jgi:hypothetical protein
MENVLSKGPRLRKKLNDKTDETQVDLQAVRLCLDTWMKSLLETLADIWKDFMESSASLQVEVKSIKVLTEAN